MSLTFSYRFTDSRPTSTVYFAFSYPWSYTECQDRLAELDLKYQSCSLLGSTRYEACIVTDNLTDLRYYLTHGMDVWLIIAFHFAAAARCFYVGNTATVTNYSVNRNSFILCGAADKHREVNRYSLMSEHRKKEKLENTNHDKCIVIIIIICFINKKA